MRYPIVVLAAVFATQVHAQNEAPSAQTENGSPPRLAPTLRARQQLMLQIADVKTRALDVTIEQWSLTAGQALDPFPRQGHLIMQLHAGHIVTHINGQAEERKAGDFWEVAQGSSCGVQAKSATAKLEVTTIKPSAEQ